MDLLAKLAPGDMIVLRLRIITIAYVISNKACQAGNNEQPGEDINMHVIAFAELVAFIEDIAVRIVLMYSSWQTWHICTRLDWNNWVVLLRIFEFTPQF